VAAWPGGQDVLEAEKTYVVNTSKTGRNTDMVTTESEKEVIDSL